MTGQNEICHVRLSRPSRPQKGDVMVTGQRENAARERNQRIAGSVAGKDKAPLKPAAREEPQRP